MWIIIKYCYVAKLLQLCLDVSSFIWLFCTPLTYSHHCGVFVLFWTFSYFLTLHVSSESSSCSNSVVLGICLLVTFPTHAEAALQWVLDTACHCQEFVPPHPLHQIQVSLSKISVNFTWWVTEVLFDRFCISALGKPGLSVVALNQS